jgi:transcription elongation GreA/GreB family factor
MSATASARLHLAPPVCDRTAMVDKARVLAALRERVAAQLAALTSSQKTAQAGATHAEAKQEHPKDTRAIESQYLARGRAARVENLQDVRAVLHALAPVAFDDDDPIALTALVGVETDEGDESLYFVVPAGGGETLVVDDTTILAVTPASPLGHALIGRHVDDEVSVELPGGLRRLTVVSVR